MNDVWAWISENWLVCLLAAFAVTLMLLVLLLVKVCKAKRIIKGLSWFETEARKEIDNYRQTIAMKTDDYNDLYKTYQLDVATLKNEIAELQMELKSGKLITAYNNLLAEYEELATNHEAFVQQAFKDINSAREIENENQLLKQRVQELEKLLTDKQGE